MQMNRTRRALLTGASALVLALGMQNASRADLIVKSGWDLFSTSSSSSFMGVNFTSNPIGSFDFGGSIGVKGTGGTDTIMHRLQDASVGAAGQTSTINIQLDALNLVTTSAVNLGAGVGLYYAVLSNTTPSLGTMAITFANDAGGTYNTSFNVDFDLRYGSVSGPIVSNFNLTMTANNVGWNRDVPSGAVVIDGVNHFLKGDGTTDQDFWPVGVVQHDASGAGHHFVAPSPVPEGSSLASMGLLLSGMGGFLLRRRRNR